MASTREQGYSKTDLMVPANGFYTYYTQDTKRPSWYEFYILATKAALNSHPGMFDEGGWGIAERTTQSTWGWLIGDYNFHQGLYPNDPPIPPMGHNPHPPASVYADFETANPVMITTPPTPSTTPPQNTTPPTTTAPAPRKITPVAIRKKGLCSGSTWKCSRAKAR